MLPNFIHAGVPKAASKTLQLILQQHPMVYVPNIKEQNFFLDDYLYEKEVDWYEKTFYANTGNAKAVGDLSIGYSSGFGTLVPKRIFETLGGEVKFIFILRQPVDRAYSNYCMARYKGQIESLEFEEAIRIGINNYGNYTTEDISRVKNGSYYNNVEDMNIYRSCVYVDTSLYYQVINRFAEIFGMNNILVLFLDDLIKNTQEQADKMFHFLGVDKVDVDFSQRANESTTLKYPFIKKISNRIYKNVLLREVLNRWIDIKVRGKIKRLLFSKNYIVHKYPKIEMNAAKVLQEFCLEDMKKLEILLSKDLVHWTSKY